MYRTNDPRFRRRLNEIGQTLESANESAQSGLYIFGQNYIRPCLSSVGQCLTSCVDASCPSLNIAQRDRLRRNRRGRAELSFDFYDDWDVEDENDALLVAGGGWGNEDVGGYGTVTEAQPSSRRRGMSYGRKGGAHDGTPETPGSGGFWGKLFGGSGKGIRYKPGAADLQDHPGAKRTARDLAEGEALLQDIEEDGDGRTRRGHGRTRSGTAASHDTSDSYSSRGDIFPSDEEDDAVPLDNEFAMVLERRTTQSGGASGDTESSSNKTGSQTRRKNKRPSTGSRASTRRTVSSRSVQSLAKTRKPRSSTGSTEEAEESIPSLPELKQEDRRVEQEEEADVERRRQEAQRLASERGLAEEAIFSSKGATPEPSQLPTPLPTDDEEEENTQDQQQQEQPRHDSHEQTKKREEDDDTQ